jgi:hypothetical protein
MVRAMPRPRPSRRRVDVLAQELQLAARDERRPPRDLGQPLAGAGERLGEPDRPAARRLAGADRRGPLARQLDQGGETIVEDEAGADRLRLREQVAAAELNPRSPVLNQPSRSKASAVASGSCW